MIDDKQLLIDEKEKYRKAWELPEYSYYSPELQEVSAFLKFIEMKPVKTILVLGCGQGHGIHKLTLAGYDVKGVDIVDVLVYPQYEKKLTIAPLWELPFSDIHFDAIFCCDVLEHIPPEKIDKSLVEINRISKFYYFLVHCRPDKLGKKIDEKLHLCIHRASWWMDKCINILRVSEYSGNPGSLQIAGRHREEKEIK